MTRDEFIKVLAYLSAGSSKSLAPAGVEVYFDCLADLPFDVLAIAAKRVILEHKFATFPTVAELREAAALTTRGEVAGMTSAEAWALARRIAANTDPEVEGDYSRQCAKYNPPPIVRQSIEAFGLLSLCYGDDPDGVQRGQFMRIYDELAKREKRHALMPAAVIAQIEASGQMPTESAPLAEARRLTAGIGQPQES